MSYVSLVNLCHSLPGAADAGPAVHPLYAFHLGSYM